MSCKEFDMAFHYLYDDLKLGMTSLRRLRTIFGIILSAGILLLAQEGCRPRAPRNLLWIVVDSLRYDHLSCSGQKKFSTPAMDALAQKGVLFERAYCSIPTTLPSIASMLTSTYPIFNGITTNYDILPDTLLTIAEVLRDKGFQTAAFVSNAVLQKATNIGQGFDSYDDDLPQREANRMFYEREGSLTAQAAIRWLDQNGRKKKFFVFIHFQDPHGPYYPHPELGKLLPRYRKRVILDVGDAQHDAITPYQILENRTDAASYLVNYAGEVIYVDRQIQGLLTELENLGLENRTAVVLTADHGESLGENGFYFQHGGFLHEAQIHVPLIMKIPGFSPLRMDHVVKPIDIAPTILDLFEFKKPEPFQGSSLISIVRSQSAKWEDLAFSQLERDGNLAIIDGREKYFRVNQKQMLFDLVQDPREKKNRFETAPAETLRLLEERKRVYQGYESRTPVIPKKLPDEKIKKALRALGYIK